MESEKERGRERMEMFEIVWHDVKTVARDMTRARERSESERGRE